MAIDFPPPPTPVQGELTSLRADASQGAIVVEVAGYRLHVHAPGVLDAVDIAAAVAGLNDLSQAVRALATAAQRKGLLLPKTLYVRSDKDIYVSIHAGRVNAVSAPMPLMPYFKGMGKEKPLTIASFEKRRLLAGIHANRMGAGYTPVFTPAQGKVYDLRLKTNAEAVSPGSVRVNLSNAGNRFTGREFLDLDARRGTASGDEFSALVRTAGKVFEIDDVEPGSDYHEYQLGWSRVTPVGLFGVSGRYLDYRQQVQALAFNGELWVADLGYTGILSSTATQRITVQGKADYLYKRLELDSDGRTLQKEPYPSLEAGVAWSRSFRVWSQSWLSLAALSARKGLGDTGSSRTLADLDYWLLRPSYSLRSQGSALTGELQLLLQYADVMVPEQQQWIVGGIGNLHAYVPGVAIGDRGLLARLVGEYSAINFEAYRISLKPRVFAEFAAAEFSQAAAGLPEGVQSLSDIGAELVLGIGPYLETALTGAFPLHDSGIARQVRDDARADFFFRFTAKF